MNFREWTELLLLVALIATASYSLLLLSDGNYEQFERVNLLFIVISSVLIVSMITGIVGRWRARRQHRREVVARAAARKNGGGDAAAEATVHRPRGPLPEPGVVSVELDMESGKTIVSRRDPQ
jgi:type VI protein secretion system component VasK